MARGANYIRSYTKVNLIPFSRQCAMGSSSAYHSPLSPSRNNRNGNLTVCSEFDFPFISLFWQYMAENNSYNESQQDALFLKFI
jgi:hypothetical protein